MFNNLKSQSILEYSEIRMAGIAAKCRMSTRCFEAVVETSMAAKNRSYASSAPKGTGWKIERERSNG